MRGYERIQRLLAPHVWPEGYPLPDQEIPEWQLASQQEVLVECSAALIEELHDALDQLDHPLIIIKEMPA